jgi:acetoin utilization protein AcuC
MRRLPNFYFHPATGDYDFGLSHPLKPERLRRTFALLERYADPAPILPEPVSEAVLRRVHTPNYLEAIATIGEAVAEGTDTRPEIIALRRRHGFFGDCPPFARQDSASRAYASASVSAARAVVEGAPLATAIGGGLHHAMPDCAAGFCILNDCALAVTVLRERFDRVAYVDIDVHHGDGVQAIFFEDPHVLTASIHEHPESLWPGTGYVHEVGPAERSINVPVPASTHAETWWHAFEQGVLPPLRSFDPQAIVLQMGTDSHYLDPLAHVNNNAQTWLRAVRAIMELERPTVALGGGGYNLTTVPRMWTAALLTLYGFLFDDAVPEDLAQAYAMPTFFDAETPGRPSDGRDAVESTLRELRAMAPWAWP